MLLRKTFIFTHFPFVLILFWFLFIFKISFSFEVLGNEDHFFIMRISINFVFISVMLSFYSYINSTCTFGTLLEHCTTQRASFDMQMFQRGRWTWSYPVFKDNFYLEILWMLVIYMSVLQLFQRFGPKLGRKVVFPSWGVKLPTIYIDSPARRDPRGYGFSLIILNHCQANVFWNFPDRAPFCY